MEIQKEKDKLSQQIEELTSQLLQSEQSKGQLANLNTVSTLDDLLKRTQQLQQDQISEQQQKQKSVQVEADPEDDTADHLIGSSILLSIRETFARGEDTQNVWQSLTTSASTKAVEVVLGALPSVPENKRALTIELLQFLVRYAIFKGQLNILDDMAPFSNKSEAHLVVLEKLQSIDADIRDDRWFIGSLIGATLMITSADNITVDQASLTSRYEHVEGVPVLSALKKLERGAAKLVNELSSLGVNLQHISQFLAEHKKTIVEAQMLLRQGHLSILQGKPMKLIDKLCRITLIFFRRTDDFLAVHKIAGVGCCKNSQLTPRIHWCDGARKCS
ncbi:hypothetical protein BWQ96_08055 [Gracilariopsis chorda]|uniref:Uncharacterized protein n=1 Tax=Gracilariopsis chorda TaxID=448386 RepID=A0A2V3IJH1_9FLOR|nr:hypothetical protein BWQ96_08055 [Gracilariopsis chorda]|eukprot:PXF42227.1 hypothetical protein BWQ96_08055 [Gracilariopsis chorda]